MKQEESSHIHFVANPYLTHYAREKAKRYTSGENPYIHFIEADPYLVAAQEQSVRDANGGHLVTPIYFNNSRSQRGE